MERRSIRPWRNLITTALATTALGAAAATSQAAVQAPESALGRGDAATPACSTPSEKPAYTMSFGHPSARSRPRSMIVSKPTSSA